MLWLMCTQAMSIQHVGHMMPARQFDVGFVWQSWMGREALEKLGVVRPPKRDLPLLGSSETEFTGDFLDSFHSLALFARKCSRHEIPHCSETSYHCCGGVAVAQAPPLLLHR